jgi:hypothetical protein
MRSNARNPKVYIPIHFSSVHYLPFRRFKLLPRRYEMRGKVSSQKTQAMRAVRALVAQKSAEFFDLRRSMLMNQTVLLQQVSVHAQKFIRMYAELKTAHVHDRT